MLMQWKIPKDSTLNEQDYSLFLEQSFKLMSKHSLYFSSDEDVESLELAHLIPKVPETVLAIYLGINDAVCNKGLVTPFLPRHAHNNVFVFDPNVFLGGDDVPIGTVDAKVVINGFAPPNRSWDANWTYVMINDVDCKYDNLWSEKGYIDMIPAKFEDFTMLSDMAISKACIYIDPKAFEHPVNINRKYLKKARLKGDKLAHEFIIPELLEGETKGLVPVILERGEKLYVARNDFQPCAHCWSNIHQDNKEFSVINENSAIPLNLVIAKPLIADKYKNKLIPPGGSADSTTDWFFRGNELLRTPIKQGHIAG